MKNLFLLLFASGIILLVACGEGDVVTITDPQIQRNIDIGIIEKYLVDKGYSTDQVDTTTSGVRYVIIEEGTGEVIDESDIVDFNYIGKFLTDTIFDTSIPAVYDSVRTAYEENPLIINGDTIPVFTSTRERNPQVVTYSSTGWTIPIATPATVGFIQGYQNGIVTTFNQVRIGAHVLIVIPSDIAYGTEGNRSPANGLTIGPNTVLAFDLFPVSVEKQ